MRLTSRTRDVRFDVDNLDDIDLTPVGKLPKLRNIYVRAKRGTIIDLAPLAGTPLEQLRLILPDGASVDLAPLANLPLTEIVLTGGPERLDLAALGRCPKLSKLMIFDAVIEEIDLAPLATCKALELIWLSDTAIEEIDLRPLAKLPVFRAIDLAKSRLARVELGTKPAFAPLQYLHVQDNPLAKLDLRALAGTHRMRALTLPIHARKTIDVSPLGPPRKDLEIVYR